MNKEELKNVILNKLQFKKLTKIQEEFLKKFETPKHLVGLSLTGTGKTHAYLLPIVLDIMVSNDKLAIILVPTNELVFQVTAMIKELDLDISVASLYGGIDKKDAERKVKTVNIIVATPEKLSQTPAPIHLAKYLVLDEADMMFDESFLSFIDLLITKIPHAKYILLSASINENMLPFINKYFGNYLLIDTRKDTNLKIKYYEIRARQKDRLSVLKDIVNLINPYLGIIFVSKKENLKEVIDSMQDKNVVFLNSEVNVRNRKKIIADIHKGIYQYLIASDLASRGIDFDASHIIHYDLPYHLEYFFHRSGRTGRMGKSGEVYVITNDNDSRKMERIKQKVEIPRYIIKNNRLVKKERTKAVNKELQSEIKKLKPTAHVGPNHKKKRKAKIEKIKKDLKRKEFRNRGKR